eukprot:3192109-Rhodomonas_salina.1
MVMTKGQRKAKRLRSTDQVAYIICLPQKQRICPRARYALPSTAAAWVVLTQRTCPLCRDR